MKVSSDNLKQIRARAAGLHSKIASDVFPAGSLLKCGKCEKIRLVSRDQCVEFLAKGWPKCCWLTMMAETQQ